MAIPLLVGPWEEGANAYTLPKAHATVALVALAVLGWISARLVTGSPRWKFTSPQLPMLAYVLAMVLSTVTSVDARLSLVGAPIRHEGLFTVASYIALFVLGVHFFGTQDGMRILGVATAAGVCVATVYGLFQLVVPPLFPGEAFMRSWYGGLGVPRLVSTVGGPVVFGGYLATFVPLVLALGASSSRNRLFWLGVGGLVIVALALTLTRAAWLAAVCGLIVMAKATGLKVVGRNRDVAVALAASAVGAAIALVLTISTQQAVVRITSATDISSGSLAQRLYIWDRILYLIHMRPWLGWGLETLGKVFPYDKASMVSLFGLRPVIVDRAHNDLLHVAFSVGVPGAFAYLAFWILVLRSAVRLVRTASEPHRVLAAGWLGALVAYLVQAQFSFSTVAFSPAVWLLAGAACGWEAGPATDGIAGARDRGNAT